jgi:PAS domain S-box-containing protein
MNKRFEEIYGWPEEDLKNITTFFDKVYPDPEYRQILKTQITEDIRSGDPDRMQWDDIEITAKNGEKRIVYAKNIPLFEQNFMISTVQDVTAQKKAEAALRTSHERFLKVLNCIDATIYVADMETCEILFMNQHMIESFGRDMTGDICWRVFRGENGPCVHCTNDRLLDENGKPADVHVWQGRNPVTDQWYINYDRAIEWIDGRLVRLQIATDITDFKKMEEELRQSQKMEAIGTLSGGIAHEFNNMLGIILGNAELGMSDMPEWNPTAEFLGEIRTASLRAKEVVRKLLSVSRKAPSHKKPVRIRSIISESLDLLRKTIPATIEIRKRFLCDTETILADSTEISQIMINLCTNAVHAMGDDAGILDVRLESASLDRDASTPHPNLKPGDYVRLVVSDSGAGIPPDILERVFDPYFTTKDVDQGLGMGLALVQGIVRKHDGAIAIRSEPGKGTTVEVLFPLIDAQPPSESQKQESPRTGSGSLLFIDDEPALVDLAKQMLKRAGYQVVGMISSMAALEMFKTDPLRFDLVITDMSMPDMPGDRLAREMMRIRPDLPIVLCTGHSDRIDEQKAQEAGVRGFMMKPFTYSELTKMVGEVLRLCGERD